MAEPQAPESPSQEEPSDSPQPAAALLANIAVLVGILGTIITFIAAGWRAFAICLIVVGVLVGGGALVYQFGRTRWYKQQSKQLRKYALYALSVVLLAAGIPMVFLLHSPGKTACTTKAQISGANTSAKSYTVTVNLPCTLPSGDQLWLITQLPDVGAAGTTKHNEYYFSESVNNTTGKQAFTETPQSCDTRMYYLIGVTQVQLALLQSSPHTEAGAYYGQQIDTYIGSYVKSNTQTNHTCN